MNTENTSLFPTNPSITLYDPLGELLGAGDGKFTYTFDDAVKLSGHACPTVAGAFLLVKVALDNLYPDGETPQRGGVSVELSAAHDEGVNGPLSQVFTLLTGAAAAQGFHGLAGQYVRKDLLRFNVDGAGLVTFKRLDTGEKISLTYSPATFPPAPGIGEKMGQVLSGNHDPELKKAFRTAWRQRVLDILEDGGKSTVHIA
ncbi:MAG: hypothetical protein HQL70_10755 [Magnetococcales bacterium]|nr:hypothetical protein [Magnetococcales bacterium]